MKKRVNLGIISLITMLIVSGCGGKVTSEETAAKAIYRVRDELATVGREVDRYIDESIIPTDKVMKGLAEKVAEAEELLESAESYSKASENIGERYGEAEEQVEKMRKELKKLEKYKEKKIK